MIGTIGIVLWVSGPALAGPNTAMLGFESARSLDAVSAGIRAEGGEVRACYRRARICLADFPSAPPLGALAALPGVRYVEQDHLMEVTPAGGYTDPTGTADCPDLWDLAAIGVGAAWTAAGGQGEHAPVVAIQDSGFLLSHEDLQGRVSGQFDYGDWDTEPEVEPSAGVPAHGTFIAGVVAADDTNDVGRAGVIPQGQLNLQKIADSDGALFFSYAVSAMADLAEGDLGVGVLSYSIGGGTYTDSFRDAVDALGDAGILLVAAAGNCGSAHCSDADNDSDPVYPASFSGEHILSVGGSLQDGSLNAYSHYGAVSVDLAAPGVDICSLGVDSDTDTYTAAGTSYATPLVAGAAALVMGAWPELTAVEVARVMRASAEDNAALEGVVRSGGVLSAERALLTAVPRLDEPGAQIIGGETTMGLAITSAAAEGEGFVVLTHDPELELLSSDPDWTAEPFSPGDALALPDAGALVASVSGTVLTGPLPARATFSLALTVRAHALLDGEVTARLVAVSEGADYLNAPYDAGDADETGFLAWTFPVITTDTWTPSDTGLDTGDTSDTALSTGDTADTSADTDASDDSGGAGDGPGSDTDTGHSHDPVIDGAPEEKGCGCASGPALPAGVPTALLLLVGLARRRRGVPQGASGLTRKDSPVERVNS